MVAKALTAEIWETWTVPLSSDKEIPRDNLLPALSTVTVSPSMKPVYSLEEVFESLFPDEESKQTYYEEKTRNDQELLLRIRQGKINPIRGWRILKKMDQKTLAEQTGILQPNLSRMEQVGAPPPKVPTLQKIADALGVSVEDLIHGR